MFSFKRKRAVDAPPPAKISASESDGPDFISQLSASKSEGLDFISPLPDCVLCSILSLLPIKESARTSILSSRWCHLWRAAPLRLDDSSLEPDVSHCQGRRGRWSTPWDWTRHAISCIFSSHSGPVRSLCLSRFTEAASYPAVDCFVESAVQRGIRDLTLNFHWHHERNRGLNRVLYQLQLPLLRSDSLQELSLTSCKFPDPVLNVMLPNLKGLRLDRVTLSHDWLQVLLSNCGYLETLYLFSCGGLRVVSVSSPRLGKFASKSQIKELKELIIEDAPNLVSFMLGEYTTSYCKVMVRNAPKLEQLGIVSVKFDVLQLGDTCFKQQSSMLTVDVKRPLYEVKTLSTVKSLAIKMEPSSNLDKFLPSLLRCFPCLENLHVQNSVFDKNDGTYTLPKGFWEKQESFRFLDQLKTVTVNAFHNRKAEVEFLRYLVVHGKVLKKIVVFICPSHSSFKVETKRRQVCIDQRASSDLELIFFKCNPTSVYESMWNKWFSQWRELFQRQPPEDKEPMDIYLWRFETAPPVDM